MRGRHPSRSPHPPRRWTPSGALVRGVALMAAMALAGCAAGQGAPEGEATPSPGLLAAAMAGSGGEPIVFLVRHAERADDDPRDPTLTPDGNRRAEFLSALLAGAGITAIYSTDWRRTRLTASPLAAATGLPVRIYDPGDSASMATFTREILEEGGRVLVVGHSNTVGPTVARLGGDPGTPMAEDEYDRLYLVVPAASGTGRTTLLRYGPPSPR
jgi:phosphohistidine phosphatase SixA